MKSRLVPICLGYLLSLSAQAKPPAQFRTWVLGLDSPNQATHRNALQNLDRMSKAQFKECIPVLIGWVRTEKNQATRFSFAKALAQPGTSVRIFGKPEVKGHRRMAVALATGRSVAEARRKAMASAKQLKVR